VHPKMSHALTTIIVGLCLYSILFVGSLVSYVWAAITNRYTLNMEGTIDRKAFYVEIFFKFCLSWFLILRIAWLVLHVIVGDTDTLMFILERVGFTLYFTTFTTVVFFWAESTQKSYFSGTLVLPSLGIGFLIINGILWAFQILVIVLWATQSGNLKGTLYEANILTDVILSTVISLAFMIYGIKQCMTRISSEDFDPRKGKEAAKTVVITMVFTFCFLLRATTYTYRLVSNSIIESNLLIVLSFYIPELAPTVLQIYLLETSKGRQAQTNQFVRDLYAGYSDSLISSEIIVPNYSTPPTTPYRNSERTVIN